MPRMTREGQAARGEGKQPLNPARSREGRQAAEKKGKQPQGLGKQPDSPASSRKKN